MKKNLKKVISAVIAFALTASSAAFAAPSFTDVADTADYAQAVSTLASLGIINGYEDGSFKPDNQITRAEVSVMIVSTINRTADAEGQKGVTPFADLNNEAYNWASGFVNVAVAEKIVAGFEDGTFGPAKNVTYTQVAKMLVCAAGYGDYAEYLGGWPNGYLSVASDKGITKGVSAGQDEAVTRAQVAQMIYNTLDIPMVESNGFVISETTGSVVPSLKIMDGKEGRAYRSILTQKHQAYVVEGYVSNTNRTNAATCDADEVEFTIQYTENYNDSEFVKQKNDSDTADSAEIILVGDTDAADYLLTYAKAIVKFNEDDDAEFVCFIPSGKNKTVSFDASLIDDEETQVYDEDGDVVAAPYVKYFASKDANKSTKYPLVKAADGNIRLFVNGTELVAFDEDDFNNFVVNNKTGVVELIDTYTADAKADGYYDVIFVTYYATAKVDSVNLNNDRIVFSNVVGIHTDPSITLDTEVDDELVYDIFLNGEAIELAAIQADDVLSIAYDVTDTLRNSKFYEIHVSRDTAEGKYTAPDPDEETVMIGGTAYEFVAGYTEQANLTLGDEYTLFLDAFGRIFDYETLASSAKLAIIDRYTKSSADDYYRAALYTADGQVKSAQVDTSRVKFGLTGTPSASQINAAITEYVYGEDDEDRADKEPIQNRVVTYKISSSSGDIIELNPAAIEKSAPDATFKTNTTAVGSVKMSASTKVVDATTYVTESNPTTSDLSLSSVTAFVADTDYTVYGYGNRNSDNSYPFVIVTSAGGLYTDDTVIAVIESTPVQSEVEGEDVYKMVVYTNGEEVEIYANDDVVVVGADDPTALVAGDIIVYAVDGKGNVKDIDVILTAADMKLAAGQDAVRAAAEAGSIQAAIQVPATSKAKNWTTSWSTFTDGETVNEGEENEFTYPEINLTRDATRLVFGPVLEKKANYFTIGTYADGKSSIANDISDDGVLGGYLEVSITDETNVYVYDYSLASKSRLDVGVPGSIVASAIPEKDLIDEGNTVDWTITAAAEYTVNYAFAKVLDDVATDVFVILSK